MKTLPTKYTILILCGLGSILRFLYGYYYTPWHLASDQIAWEILLNEGSLSYDQLIHYPHEGGSILISILSHLIKLFTAFNSLTIAAFILDFISRWIQLTIVHKVFDTKKITLLFGIWTIFGAATIIPWATVNFGLHSISSFFPFILLFLIWLNKDTPKQHICTGIILGLACWFSYSNIILILVYLLLKLFERKASYSWLYSLLSLAAILFIHVIVRQYMDAGFYLDAIKPTSIRGTEFMLDKAETWQRMYQVWYTSLANSIIAAPKSVYLVEWIKYVWLFIIIVGLLGFIRTCFHRTYPKRIAINSLTILIFIFIYAISPFCSNIEKISSYIAYRHLAYILPLLSLITIIGLYTFKSRIILIPLFLLIAFYSSSLLFTQPFATAMQKQVAEKAAGWVLVNKMGHDTKRLYHIISTSKYDDNLLIQGVGWGLSTILFKDLDENDSKGIEAKIALLKKGIEQFPSKYKDALLEGITFSFSSDVTPRLQRSILLQFQNELKKK